MTKSRRNIGAEMLEGIREIKRGEHGRVTKIPAVADVRERTGLSQPQFAKLLGVSVRTLQEWGTGAARAIWFRTHIDSGGRKVSAYSHGRRVVAGV